MPVELTKKGVVISVQVQPRSSRSAVEGVVGEFVKVKLTSAPVDNRANRELVELISDRLGVSKKEVEIIGGEKGRKKRILVKGLSPSEVKNRLGI